MTRTRNTILVALAAAALGGCVEVGPPPPPRPAISCHKPDPAELGRIRRVVFVDLAAEGEGTPLSIADVFSRAVYEALQEKRLFHIYRVDRTDQVYRDLGLDQPRRYTVEQLRAIRDTLKVDAVLIGKVRDFQQMPRMHASLYLSLVDVNQGRVVWGVDHYWDTTDRLVEKRIKTFYDVRMRSGYDPMHHEIAMASPRTFAKFVAFEAAQTLTSPPPVPDIPPGRRGEGT